MSRKPRFPDNDLAKRMHHYECLIFTHYQREPVALAIVTDKRPGKEASFYAHSFCGTALEFHYFSSIKMTVST
jgi:hypothetical protein